MLRFCLRALTALAVTFGVADAHAEKIPVERADDLPRHTYTIDGAAVDLLEDRDLLLELAREVAADLRSDLEAYAIEDATTLKNYHGALGTVALVEGRYDDYREHLAKVRELETKEAQRLLAGLTALAWIDAIQQPEREFEEAYEDALRDRVNALPYEVVEADLKQRKGMMEIVNRTLLEGMVQAQIQPQIDRSDGVLTKNLALGLVQQGFAVHMMLPHKDVIARVYAEYLDAHAVEKQDIWQARSVDLSGRDDLTEVVIGVWDSGVDESIFAELDQIWTNPGEVAGDGADDDGNGYVDDVHGIYFDTEARIATEPLYPVGEIDDPRRLQRQMKGLRDVQMSIDSPEADALKERIDELGPDEVEPFMEAINAYGNHSHGTHVAGIAAEGNPAARIMNARLSFDHEMIPPKPTRERTERWADSYRAVVAYFRDHGVRVVNMSWGGSVADIEAALAAHNDPADPEERKALAREYFEIGKQALTEAMAGAPDVLFCVAAGNSDNDNVFEEFVPSSIELPNIITVGAVDQAGEETSFTTFGKVDVYASGFDVDSYVPGGDRLALNGTSMASPNVANLAAKILAIRPDLDPVTVKQLIVDTADVIMAGDREVRRIHPEDAIAALDELPTSSRR